MSEEQVWQALTAARGLWGWGDDDGIVPWAGEDGRDVVPLWASAELAAAGAGTDGDPGEAPVFLDLDTLLAEIPGWLGAGIGTAVLSAGGDGFPVPLTDLTERLLRLQVDGPA
ncbi:hypothetical protein ACI78V_15250 [Geodermatophilus sp. SYSU D00742]